MTTTNVIIDVIAQQAPSGPLGPDFGKASPIGLLVGLLMLAFVFYLGWAFNRRARRMARRRCFAEEHGLDVFDHEGIDKAMKAEGLYVDEKKYWL